MGCLPTWPHHWHADAPAGRVSSNTARPARVHFVPNLPACLGRKSGFDNTEARRPMAPYREIGVALSGGGVRASLASLGALLYVVDVGINEEVGTIASVSGGSITNAFVAQECDFRTATPETFDPIAKKLAVAIVHRGVLIATLISKLYV